MLKIIFGLAVAVCMLSQAHAAAIAEPIARAAKGQLQCYSPDASQKTCAALVSFKAGPDGRIRARADILISPNPLIMMTGMVPVTPKSGELCGVLTENDFKRAVFTDGQSELDPMQAGLLRTVLTASLQSYFGREICGAFAPTGGAYVVKAKMDGAFLDADSQRVIWVRPDEHYRLAP